jgi:hypothetical protein
MSNDYNAKALAWQLNIDGETQPVLGSEELSEGTNFSITGRLPGSFYVYVVEMKGNSFVNLLLDSGEPLSDEVTLPSDGSLTTDAFSLVRAIAAPDPVPQDAWPSLLLALFKIHRQGPPSPGNSDTM